MIKLRSKCQSLNIAVRVDDITVRIQFTPKGTPYMYGYYYCKDDKVFEAIKATPEYKSGMIYPETDPNAPQTESKKETTPTREYAATFPGIKRTQEAKKILVEQYHIAAESITKKEDAINAADKLNISFPDLK